MSAVATAKRAPAMARRLNRARGSRPFDDRATLESGILSAWEGLVVEGRCACPVCDGAMVAADGSGACGSCGSELS
ncbi:MAG: hypothetical protein ACR2G3_03500 [Solirubrobacterales bacterium]